MSRYYFKVLQHLDNAICYPFVEGTNIDEIRKTGQFECWYPDGYTILSVYTEEQWRTDRPYETKII